MPGILDEIQEQPDALHRTLDAVGPELASLAPFAEKLKQGALRRVLFTGMGGSFHPATPPLMYLLEHGIDADMMESSELLYHYRSLQNPRTLMVMVSQSGKSVEIVKLLEQNGKHVPVIAITNYPDSPLALQSDAQLYIRAGVESTVSTKTNTCTVLVLHLLARVLSGEPLQPEIDKLRHVADAVGKALPYWNKRAEELAASLKDSRFLMFVGRGPSRASAMTAALIAKETTKLPTEGMVGGQFRHGPMEVLAPGVVIFLFAPPGRTRGLDQSLAADLGKLNGQTIVVGTLDQPVSNVLSFDVSSEHLDEWTTPIIEIIPIQLFAARLAMARGLEAGKFRYGQKVTTTE